MTISIKHERGGFGFGFAWEQHERELVVLVAVWQCVVRFTR